MSLSNRAQQILKFTLLYRRPITVVLIALAVLPLFNFTTMSILAFFTFPLLVSALDFVLYSSETTGILGQGLKVGGKSQAAKTFNAVFEMKSYDLDTQLTAGKKLGGKRSLLMVFKMIRDKVLSPLNVKAQWRKADKPISALPDWKSLLIEVCRIVLIYTSVYYAAVAAAPMVISPLRMLLGLAGPVGLVASYFLALGIFHASACAVKAIQQSKHAEGNAIDYTTITIGALGTVTLTICAIVLAKTSIFATIMSIPTVMGVITPVALLLVAMPVVLYKETANALQVKPAGGSSDVEMQPLNPPQAADPIRQSSSQGMLHRSPRDNGDSGSEETKHTG